MDYCTVGARRCDGGEAEIIEPILTGVFLMQQLAVVELTYRLAGTDLVFQALETANFGGGRVTVSVPAGSDLSVVLDCLEHYHRIGFFTYCLLFV